MSLTDLMLCEVQRRLPMGEPVNLAAAVEHEWQRLVLPPQVKGKRIAIGVGSRGVAGIQEIVRHIVTQVRESGGEPFIVPAMGSHGGATPDGQTLLLHSLGIDEPSVGCPIHATMETVILGHTERGLPVYFDRNATEADGIIVINRVKPHTDFHAPTESGLLKMLAIGLGKERGAALLHSYGVTGIRDYTPEVASVILQNINLIAGFATVEDGYHRPVILEAFTAQELPDGERRLLKKAHQLAPRLPVNDLDVLIVDEIGKEISGTGMDTNVIGRLRIAGHAEPETPRIKAIVVLDLTEASHGNALGIGLADFTTRRLLEKIDFQQTAKNVFTSGFLERGRLPLVFNTDEEAIYAALNDIFRAQLQNREYARIMRIHNTLALETIWVSPNLLAEIQQDSSFISSDLPQ